jgi:hypothetical protein
MYKQSVNEKKFGDLIMKHLLTSLASIGLLLIGTQAQALVLTPGDCVTATCDTGSVNSQSVINTFITANYPTLTELYKQDVGAGSDVGSLAGSYQTTFANSTNDPEEATITYVSGDAVSCPTCLLLVKDGNQDPAWYLFDISSVWDGMETIQLNAFWPQQGAISHVTLYGASTVPEPQILALLGIGLLGFVIARRKVSK